MQKLSFNFLRQEEVAIILLEWKLNAMQFPHL